MAALWDLPVVFVCENNHYGMGTSEDRSSKSALYYTRGDYVPGMKADGMDALAVKQAVAYAKEHCVSGKGPFVLELDTYRYHGHSMSDPGSTYRTRDEVSGVRQERDPVDRIRKLLLEHDIAKDTELKAWEKDIRKQIDKAVDFAKASALPEAGALYEDVLVDAGDITARTVSNDYAPLR